MARAYAFNEDGKRRVDKSVHWTEQFREQQNRRNRRQVSPFDDLRIYNGTNDAMPQYGIGKVTGISTVSGEKFATVEKPDTTFSRQYLVNAGDDLAYQTTGIAKNRPVVKVLYDTGTPAVGETWGAKNGQWAASLGYPGLTCIGIVSATDKIMLARMEIIDHLIGKPGTTVAKGASGSFTVWLKSTGSWAASSYTITAEALGAECTSGKYAKLEYVSGYWIAGPLEC